MFRVIFSNIYQGMHFAGEDASADIFYGYKPTKYLEWFNERNPDILCIAEAPIDDEKGNSLFLDNLKKTLGFTESKVYVNDKSWIVEGKYYGMAILSKFAIQNYETFNLPNPKLEVDHPDGSHWIMHDKGAQKATVKIKDREIDIYNLHYYPVHHFKRNIDEDEFIPIRKALADALTTDDKSEIIICGDFNNKGTQIKEAFPELFLKRKLNLGVKFDRNDYEPHYSGDGIQIDHILHSDQLKITNSEVVYTYSDHCALIVDFKLST